MRLVLALLLLALAAPCQTLDIKTQTLANGMKVIVQEDHGIPNVAMYFFYRIGSRNERPGTTGLSHFFEHMMFNGAKKYGPKQFDKTMDNIGGNNNAYTTNDVTVYTDWFPSSALELMFDMEADRIRDLAFDPKIIESRARRGVLRAALVGGQQQLRHALGTGGGHGVRGASVPLAGGRLALGYRVVDHGRSEEPLPHGLRAQQLRDGDGGRRAASTR